MEKEQNIYDVNYYLDNNKDRHLSIFPFVLILLIGFVNLITNESYASILLLLDLFILSFQFIKIVKFLSPYYMLFIISLLIGFLATLLNGSGLGTFIGFTILLLFLTLGKDGTFDRKQIRRLDLLFLVLTSLILFIYRNNVDSYYVSMINGSKLNPNGYATVVLAFGMIAPIVIREYLDKNCFYYIFNVLSAIITVYMIHNTYARTSLVAYFGYLALIFISLYYRKKKNIKGNLNDGFYPKFMLFVLICSLSVVFIYVSLYNVLDGREIVILGKNLFTGREALWSRALSLYSDHIFIGFSNKTMLWGDLVNLHNGFVTVLCHLTFVNLIAIICMFLRSVFVSKYHLIDDYKYFAILCFIFMATFESMFTDTMFFFLMFPFILSRRSIEYDQ